MNASVSSTAVVAIGGNLGDVPATFQQAAELLAPHARSAVRVSRLYRSVPMGTAAGATFCNAAVAFECDLEPEVLLDRLQEIETQLGRVRTIHWGPRTLDLDLVAYGDRIMSTPRLTLPHTHCWYRRFVLDPVCDVAPTAMHAGFHVSFGMLRERLLPRPLRVAFELSRLPKDAEARLKAEFSSVVFLPLTAAAESAITIHHRPLKREDDRFSLSCPESSGAEQFVRDVLIAATDELSV